MSGTIVVILARAGSVRLPRKNVTPFLGRPMISWTYERALALRRSGLGDHLVVSTDDPEVAKLAPAGVTVIQRPAELATSTATSFDAMAHAVRQVEAVHGPAKALVLLQPTSPLATPNSTIDVVKRAHQGIAVRQGESFISIASLTAEEQDIASVVPDWRLAAKGNGVRPLAELLTGRAWQIERVTDDLATHLITGATYAIERNAFFEASAILLPAPRTIGVVVPASEAVDIDTKADFAAAEAIGKFVQMGEPTGFRGALEKSAASIELQRVNAATTHMRKGNLTAMAQVLAECDPNSTAVMQLTGRLRRLCSQALRDATEPHRIAALTPVMQFLSPVGEFAPPVAAGLADSLRRQLGPNGGQAKQDFGDWFGALAPLLARCRADGILFDTVLDLVEGGAHTDSRKSAMLAVSLKWREVGYEGLTDTRLARLSALFRPIAA